MATMQDAAAEAKHTRGVVDEMHVAAAIETDNILVPELGLGKARR